ncbi:MAG TPA: tetratricopeptide repeat protein, partial [Pirellulales bacterium]
QFVLDDPSSITDNAKIKNVFDLPEIFSINPRRFVVYFSFAVNWALSQYHPGPYHVVNIFIHVTAALLLYDLTRMALRTPRLAPWFGREAPALAAAIAVLWAVHPLQTQSVTYVVQRTESLMGMFFLLTFWLTARGALGPRSESLGFYIGAVVACWLGAFTKEVMIVAPLTLLLFDFTILANDWREVVLRRFGLYLACFASCVPLVVNSFDTLDAGSHAMGFGSTLISSQDFAKTQPEVILHYLKISFFPADLCIDYRWPVEQNGFIIAVSSFALGMMFGASLLALYYFPPLGFVGLWFFFTLAPSSSVIPIIDLAFEHRMYLALASVCVLTVLGFWRFWNALLDAIYPYIPLDDSVRLGVPALLFAIAATGLGVRTIVRNFDYYTAERLWRDVVRQSPHNPRAYHNLAVELENSNKDEEAVEFYEKAIELGGKAIGHPLYKYHFNFGISLRKLKRWEECAREFGEAARLSPTYAEAYANQAIALAELHRTDEAIASLKNAVKHKPSLNSAHAQLADLLVKKGEYTQAIEHAETVLKTDPAKESMRLAEARAYCGQGNYSKARGLYEGLQKDSPFDRTVKAELAWLSAACPDPELRFPNRAKTLAQEVLNTAPKAAALGTIDVLAREALAAALASEGKYQEAAAAADRAAKEARESGDEIGAIRIESRRAMYVREEPFTFTPSPEDYLGR